MKRFVLSLVLTVAATRVGFGSSRRCRSPIHPSRSSVSTDPEFVQIVLSCLYSCWFYPSTLIRSDRPRTFGFVGSKPRQRKDLLTLKKSMNPQVDGPAG